VCRATAWLLASVLIYLYNQASLKLFGFASLCPAKTDGFKVQSLRLMATALGTSLTQEMEANAQEMEANVERNNNRTRRILNSINQSINPSIHPTYDQRRLGACQRTLFCLSPMEGLLPGVWRARYTTTTADTLTTAPRHHHHHVDVVLFFCVYILLHCRTPVATAGSPSYTCSYYRQLLPTLLLKQERECNYLVMVLLLT